MLASFIDKILRKEQLSSLVVIIVRVLIFFLITCTLCIYILVCMITCRGQSKVTRRALLVLPS